MTQTANAAAHVGPLAGVRILELSSVVRGYGEDLKIKPIKVAGSANI